MTATMTPMITMTAEAVSQLKEFLDEQGTPEYGLRVFVVWFLKEKVEGGEREALEKTGRVTFECFGRSGHVNPKHPHPDDVASAKRALARAVCRARLPAKMQTYPMHPTTSSKVRRILTGMRVTNWNFAAGR